MIIIIVITRWKGTQYFWVLTIGSLLILFVVNAFHDQLNPFVSGTVITLSFLVFMAIIGYLVWISFVTKDKNEIKINLAKTFSLYKYNYRERWLGFNAELDRAHQQDLFYSKSIKAMADLIESPSGKLWSEKNGRFIYVDHWNAKSSSKHKFSLPIELCQFIEDTNWVIDLKEYQKKPEMYQLLSLPFTDFETGKIDILVPLKRDEKLVGIVGLESKAGAAILNWEDHDLLKAAGQQMASYIGLFEATTRIYEQRQLEAFNRLSAFVVHDLKNVSAQLQLITQNAEKFKDNQDFINDTFDTVVNADLRIRKMLNQLGRKNIATLKSEKNITDLHVLINAIKDQKADIVINKNIKNVRLYGSQQQLVNIILHLDDNACNAVSAAGGDFKKDVLHRLEMVENDLYWIIEDKGIGMSEEFVRLNLFKPFETTKGNAGLGIGVYQCRHLLRSFGGDLIVQSRVGEGTRCTVILTTIVEDNDEPE